MLDQMHLPPAPDAMAPDGSAVRVLLRVEGCSMAHFELAPGVTSAAVRHRTVEEIWYVVGGQGEMWRRQGSEERTAPLVAGDCVTIPRGTAFQFRAIGAAPLQIIGATVPPWPGPDEAMASDGPWSPTVGQA